MLSSINPNAGLTGIYGGDSGHEYTPSDVHLNPARERERGVRERDLNPKLTEGGRERGGEREGEREREREEERERERERKRERERGRERERRERERGGGREREG